MDGLVPGILRVAEGGVLTPQLRAVPVGPRLDLLIREAFTRGCLPQADRERRGKSIPR
jgi:hypothetical protein